MGVGSAVHKAVQQLSNGLLTVARMTVELVTWMVRTICVRRFVPDVPFTIWGSCTGHTNPRYGGGLVEVQRGESLVSCQNALRHYESR